MLFPDIAQAIWTFRSRMKSPLLQGQTFEDAEIELALRAAESDAEHALRVFFGPVEVLPESATQAEKDALDEAGTRWIEEPGYDLDGEFFAGERWGYLVTRQRPIISVSSMVFAYPQPVAAVYTVPASWIRVDKKFGHIRLVPSSQAFVAPLSMFVMQVIGGGLGLPQAIQIRYRAGLQNAAQKYPDLLDVVQRMALMRLVQNLMLPVSGSISADGLSESISVDLAKAQDDIDRHLERLRQVIHGVQVAFL